jgi:protein-S-isoprenylcysteine O-methyltransferase Ste14
MVGVVGVVLVLGLLMSVATSIVVLRVLWRATRDQWKRTPPERRPWAVAAGAGAVIFIVVGLALSIAALWGPHSAAFVFLIGGGGLMVVVLLAVAGQAVQDRRRAKRNPPAAGESPHEE